MKRTFLALAVVIVAVLAAALRPTGTPPRPPIHIFAGVDRSLSAEPQLGAYAHCLADLAAALEPQDRLTLYRFDRDPYEFYDGPVPDDIEHFKTTLLQSLSPQPKQRGTRPAYFLKVVADRLESEEGRSLIVMLSDGGNDDRSSDRIYHDAVRRIQQRPGLVGLAVLGTLPAQRQELRDYFAPLGTSLRLHGPQDINANSLLDQISGK